MMYFTSMFYLKIITFIIYTLTSLHQSKAAPTFFFLCHYHMSPQNDHHSNLLLGAKSGEIELSVTIENNPEYYEPNEIYKVRVTSTNDFDGFMMTGLYTMPEGLNRQSGAIAGMPMAPISGKSIHGLGVMCSIVHSNVSQRPRKTITFSWQAPPANSGCIEFLATGMLDQHVIFKDILTLRLCEQLEGKVEEESTSMGSLHQHGVIFRDDFESITNNETLWKEIIGVSFSSDKCNSLMHGNAAVFCDSNNTRILTSSPLNTTSTASIQFSVGPTNCSLRLNQEGASSTETNQSATIVQLMAGINSCQDWILIENFTIPIQANGITIHIIPLPLAARSNGVCLRWAQETTNLGCWAMDNVLLTNMANLPGKLLETFDSMDPGNWLFFPGGKISGQCQTRGNALTFDGRRHSGRTNYATTRDIEALNSSYADFLSEFTSQEGLFEEGFDSASVLKGWILKGGHIGQRCGVVHHKKAIVFDSEPDYSLKQETILLRKVCTPFLDATKAGVLSFHIVQGNVACNAKTSVQDRYHVVKVMVETNIGDNFSLQDILLMDYQNPKRVVIALPVQFQVPNIKFCWKEHQNRTSKQQYVSIWALDTIQLLPWLPQNNSQVLQFYLNMNCNDVSSMSDVVSSFSLLAEFSTDRGNTWNPLHSMCLAPTCGGIHLALNSHFWSQDYSKWTRITLPLPFAALLIPTRYRFHQIGISMHDVQWAIDDLYIGPCLDGCNGHGQCQDFKCHCDFGYEGSSCNNSLTQLPEAIFESFTFTSQENDKIKVLGAILGYQCGILSRGKAAVFNGRGTRRLTTNDLNTTKARFMEFTIRLGSPSKLSKCPGPDLINEGIYIHCSCNGGFTWEFVKYIPFNKYKMPSRVTIVLPPASKGASCRFRIWQPKHSGQNHDVWGIDDFSINVNLLNSIFLNFVDEAHVNRSLVYNLGNLGKFCQSNTTLTFPKGQFKETENERGLETKPLAIGPSFMIQFELVIGCNSALTFKDNKRDKVYLDYSLDHESTWHPVQSSCLPPYSACAGIYTQGTVYDITEYKKWKRVTINLPSATWSTSTRFRLWQTNFTKVDSWAVDNLYIGPACPDLCNGHGWCEEGICRCDDGFYSARCLPKEKLRTRIKVDMASMNDLQHYGFDVAGGETVIKPSTDWSTITPGSVCYFYMDGVRQLITPVMNTENVDLVQFFLTIGADATIKYNSSRTAHMTNVTEMMSSVLLQFSNNAGISWHLLKELAYDKYNESSFESLFFPEEAKTDSTQIRWWQPEYGSRGRNTWTVDKIRIGQRTSTTMLQGLINATADRYHKQDNADDTWAFSSTMIIKPYCISDGPAFVFDGQEPFRFAITKELTLNNGDVIQFKISVGCTDTFSAISPVTLEYSHDCAVSWTKVQEQCYPGNPSCGTFTEASIYYMGSHGQWTLVVLPISPEMAKSKISFRWSQHRSGLNDSLADGAFALKDIYIGMACSHWCYGHGICSKGICQCDFGYKGPACDPEFPNPSDLKDMFDDENDIFQSDLWASTRGGKIGQGCGPISLSNTLFFEESGTREARTRSLDTRKIKSLHFLMRIGWKSATENSACFPPTHINESLILQYSLTAGLSWLPLQVMDFQIFQTDNLHNSISERRTSSLVAYTVNLSPTAKSADTSFRWWQPIGSQFLKTKGIPRASWALDNVYISARHSSIPGGFWEDFEPINSSHWFMTVDGSINHWCKGDGDHLFFEDGIETQFAETHDFALNAGAFLQFDIIFGCQLNSFPKIHRKPIEESKFNYYSSDSALKSNPQIASYFAIAVEYSVDGGHTWQLIQDNCAPPSIGCNGNYHMSSNFYSHLQNGKWNRITIPLPTQVGSFTTRIRWSKTAIGVSSKSVNWALDNIYLGHDCQWLCSGHGVCRNGQCKCDAGFSGPHCVADIQFSREFRDTFDHKPEADVELWSKIYNGQTGIDCGVLVSGSALAFTTVGLRMAITRNLDLSQSSYIQFTVKMGCSPTVSSRVFSEDAISSSFNAIVIQFSNNGGITWHMIKEVPYRSNGILRRYSLSLHELSDAFTNATQIRFWQPSSQEENKNKPTLDSSWAIDSVFVGGQLVIPNVFYTNYEAHTADVQPDGWLDWPGGEVQSYCNSSGKRRAMVFNNREGERTAYTRDIQVNSDTAVQFDILVGCDWPPNANNPVRLEYSTNLGHTWKLVRESDKHDNSPTSTSIVDIRDYPTDLPSVFYANAQKKWKRVIISLEGLGICGTVRFRWYQGYFTKRENPPHWGLDNVHIGPSCSSYCNGQGDCLNGFICQCDHGYSGTKCVQSYTTNPTFIEEHFDYDESTNKSAITSSEENWEIVSGAEVSRYCGVLTTGESLVFNQPGERLLTSGKLNLVTSSNPSLQFHIRLGCQMQSHMKWDLNKTSTAFPVTLQYSINGGIIWKTMEKFHFPENQANPQVIYVNLELPTESLTSDTKLRWWQPSEEGQFSKDWAIDKIYVNSDHNGLSLLKDDFKSVPGINWNSLSGSRLEPVCGKTKEVLHFSVVQLDERYAITADVKINESSFMQFELSMGCNDASKCFDIELHYSLNSGKTWHYVLEGCTWADKCLDMYERSTYRSDVYKTFTRITIILPYYTQSQGTRFRWIQTKLSETSETWALDAVYVGDECPDACNGRGKCDGGQCLCDEGWTERDCSISKSPLPVELRDNFSSEPSSKQWAIAKGGVISNLCGSIGSGAALHFYGGCSRLLQTVSLNLKNALYIRFDFQFGCILPPKKHSHVVLLQYSVNNGIKWTTLTELNYFQHKNKSTTVILLPPGALQVGISVRWWQPKHIKLAHGDWALDNIVISGKTDPATSLQDLVNGVFAAESQWVGHENIDLKPYCGSANSVAFGESTGTENAFLETVDILAKIGYTLEFMIAVGCDSNLLDAQSSTVSLQYSMDYGLSWQLFRPSCVPMTNLVSCFNTAAGVVGPPSIYSISGKWRRIVLPLYGKMINNTVRFRWIQLAAHTTTTNWGIQNIYIGPGCPNYCHGHGSCISSKCICDSGYNGNNCSASFGKHPRTIRETFEDSQLDPSSWSFVLGGSVQMPCQPLHGQFAMVFNMCSQRLLETKDMDLSNAKFVQYTVVIGGSSKQRGCSKPSSRNQNVYFQYSNDGGISWHVLRELDYSEFGDAKPEYVVLPANARSSSQTTRLRWWQMEPLGCHRQTNNENAEQSIVSFAIDNVLIGGSDINPAYFKETFENSTKQFENWWFYPEGQMVKNFCRSVSGTSMAWRTSKHDNERMASFKVNQPGSLTTRELIVGEDYILQFKIIVGCGSDTWICNSIPAITLEYSTDPVLGIWNLLTPGCYPGKPISKECFPNNYHWPSTYHADVYSNWTTITIKLPEKAISSQTQFRWQENGHWTPRMSWAIDDIYIGESCPNACSGRGDCLLDGHCECVENVNDDDCGTSLDTRKPNGLYDAFDNPSPEKWKTISGGEIGTGCGNLFPWGQGKQLYFSGCGYRQAVTGDMDLTLARKISFILRIGNIKNTSSCNIDLYASDVESKTVVLQYSINNGIHWEFMANHRPQDFVQPKRVMYDIPFHGQVSSVQFRWWQPYHGGLGKDQWALDNVEFIMIPLFDKRPSHARMNG